MSRISPCDAECAKVNHCSGMLECRYCGKQYCSSDRGVTDESGKLDFCSEECRANWLAEM